MFLNCKDFYETENGFMSNTANLKEMDFNTKKLVVKAHEKEIYTLMDKYILAVIHRDNNGIYNFSKLDFLTHKIQEIIYPQFVPKIYFGFFENADTPSFVLERKSLDKMHIAYNILRQNHHQAEGKNYYYDSAFLKLYEEDDIEALSKEHVEKVEAMQDQYMHLLDKYGVAFDHSMVNITWDKIGNPVSLEVHKARRHYLFNFDKCSNYFNSMDNTDEKKQMGLTILNRIDEIQRMEA